MVLIQLQLPATVPGAGRPQTPPTRSVRCDACRDAPIRISPRRTPISPERSRRHDSGGRHGPAADRRHQRSRLRGIRGAGGAGGADGRPARGAEAPRRRRRASRSSTSTTTSASGGRTSGRRSRIARRDRHRDAPCRGGCGRRAKDYFVLKPKHSGFFDTTLDTLLETLGIRRVILAGIAGNICVLFTANDAYMRELKLFAPADCIVSNTAGENDHALRQIETVLKGNVGLVDAADVSQSRSDEWNAP